MVPLGLCLDGNAFACFERHFGRCILATWISLVARAASVDSISARQSASKLMGRSLSSWARDVINDGILLQEPREVMERSCFGAQSLQAVSPELEKYWVSSESARSPNKVEFLFRSLAFCEALRVAVALPICA